MTAVNIIIRQERIVSEDCPVTAVNIVIRQRQLSVKIARCPLAFVFIRKPIETCPDSATKCRRFSLQRTVYNSYF